MTLNRNLKSWRDLTANRTSWREMIRESVKEKHAIAIQDQEETNAMKLKNNSFGTVHFVPLTALATRETIFTIIYVWPRHIKIFFQLDLQLKKEAVPVLCF